MFNSRFGKLHDLEFAEYLKEANPARRHFPSADFSGFTPGEAIEEARRCMHCDCRAAGNCKLRIYSDNCQADQKRFQTTPRRAITKQIQTSGVVYEKEKCIKCGICVRLTKKYREKFGLTFIGRGFDVIIGIPFDESLDAALVQTAQMVARHCPTGALEIREMN